MNSVHSKCHVCRGDNVTLETLCEAFNLGFEDYKYGTRFTPPQLQSFLLRSGVNAGDCAVLVTDTQPEVGVGIALLALHGQNAWCAGLAVAATYRRSGYASALMDSIEANARAKGVARLYLEVLAENQIASAMYEKRGYQNLRMLHIWQHIPTASVPAGNGGVGFVNMEVEPLLNMVTVDQQIERPPWQRSPHFLLCSANELLAVKTDGRTGHTGAFVILRPSADDNNSIIQLRIADIGVLPGSADLSAIADLLAYVVQEYAGASKTLLNEPDDSPLSSYLTAAGFQVVETQYEMVKELF